MKNPLVLLVGAAVAAVAVLAGVTADRWREWPSPILAPAETDAPVAEEAAEPAPQPAKVPAEPEAVETVREPDIAERTPPGEQLPETVVQAPAVTPEEDLAVASDEPAGKPELQAALDPEPAPAAQPADPEESAAPEPVAVEAVQPSFDVVRVEEDGSLIAVGRAAPGAEIALLLDGQEIATSPASESGEWLIMPDQPLPPGSHELMVQAGDAGSGNTSQAIAVAVPERPGRQPQVVLSEPARPSQAPDSPQLPEADDEAEELVAAAPEPAPDEAPAALAPAPGGEVPKSDAEDQIVALAPPPVEAPVEPEAAPEPEPPARLQVPLALETVDYNDDGDIVFSGRADAGSTVRIYVDNRFVGETAADEGGRWVFAGREQLAPGHHTLRADLLDGTGDVFGRVELPFVRADSREIAALVESRRDAAEDREPAPQAVEVPQPAAPEPLDAPAVAEAAAPEPEPEAPPVAEAAAPEPEPEAPAVAEAVAPEPEPAAPAVAEAVAPEPEPAVPAVAAPVPPVPQPAAPAVAEAVTPDPEPETPAPAAEPAPEPAEEPSMAEAPSRPEMPEVPEAAETVPAPQAPMVAAVEPKPAPEAAPRGPGHVVIQPGNNLWRISRVIYGRGVQYTVIYQANRGQIRDPDLIYPGQIFATPGVHPPKEIDPEWRQPLTPEELTR